MTVAELESQGKTALYVEIQRGRVPGCFAIDPEIVGRTKAGDSIYVARDGAGHHRCLIRDLADLSVSRAIDD